MASIATSSGSGQDAPQPQPNASHHPVDAPAEDTPSHRRRRRGAVRASIVEGLASTPVLSASGNYVTPFALALNASSFQIGLLNGWPNLAAALSQFFAPSISRALRTRRRMLLLSVLLSIVAWGGMMAIPFLLPGNKVWWLLALATLSLVAYYLPQGAFGSWMADLVPAKRLGKVQGIRTSLGSVGAIVVILGGGFILDWFDSRIFLGFSIVFGTILALRLSSWVIFARMYEPPYDPKAAPRLSFKGFLRDVLGTNLGFFLIGYAVFFYGISISGPFFSVFMLKELGFSYLTYMAVSVSATVVTLFAVLAWGPFADKYGNVRALKLSVAAIIVVPLLWLAVDNAAKAYVMNVIAGVFWAGMSMVSLNFVYEASPREERVRNVAYLFAFQGVATFLGNMTGGAILPHVPKVFGSSVMALFIISAAVRLGGAAIIFAKVREVRHIARGEGGKGRRMRLPQVLRK